MGSFLKKIDGKEIVEAHHNARNIRLQDAVDSFMFYVLTLPPKKVAIEIIRHARKFHVSHEAIAEFYTNLRSVCSILRISFNIPNIPLVVKKIEPDKKAKPKHK